MPTTGQFIALAERNVKIGKAMMQAIKSMQIIELASLEVEGRRLKLNFSREIEALKEALYLIGQDGDE